MAVLRDAGLPEEIWPREHGSSPVARRWSTCMSRRLHRSRASSEVRAPHVVSADRVDSTLQSRTFYAAVWAEQEPYWLITRQELAAALVFESQDCLSATNPDQLSEHPFYPLQDKTKSIKDFALLGARGKEKFLPKDSAEEVSIISASRCLMIRFQLVDALLSISFSCEQVLRSAEAHPLQRVLASEEDDEAEEGTMVSDQGLRNL